ncbi:MAG: hypothetical protein ACSHX7_11515 [Luteolibacter sp.]
MPRRRANRLIKRLAIIAILLLILLPLIAFGLSNLYLVSPKGQRHIGSRITAFTRMESSVKGATWSPWNGITVYGIEIKQPPPLREEYKSPLLRIQSVRCVPVWKKLATKTLEIRNLDLTNPELSIPIEFLSQIPRTAPPELASKTQVTSPPATPAASPPALAQNHIPTPTSPVAPAQDQHPAPAQASNTPPSNTVQEPTRPQNIPPAEAAPTVSVTFTGGRFTLLSTFSEKPLYRIASASGSIPIAGKPKTSTIILNRVSSLGNLLSEKTEIPVNWKAPFLDFGPFEFSSFETEGTLACRLFFTPGIPFIINGNIPEQKDLAFQLPGSLKTKIGVLTAQGGFQGLLRNPTTWQGKAIARSSSIHTEYGTGVTDFEFGRAVILYGNGTLSCVDARLVSETTSLLANGTLLTDGRCASNARIVSTPEILASISRYTQQDSKQAHLTPLSTPQRAALDLQLFGRLGEIYFKPNPMAAPISLSGK